MATLKLQDVILKLFDVSGLKFGEFTLRTGEISPVYIDMRVIWTYPDLVRSISELIWEEVKKNKLEFDVLCGLPYQGIPLASYLSTKYDIPMLLKRQSVKTYGTCNMFEGDYKKGDRVLLIDDVLMTGGTLIKDIPDCERHGLDVVGTVVFCDRDQGGANRTKQLTGKDSFSVATIGDLLKVLQAADKVTQADVGAALDYLKTTRFDTADYLKADVSSPSGNN